MARVLFVQATYDEYISLVSKDDSTVYFLTDKQQIYKGENLYGSNDFRFVGEVPAFENAEEDKLYVIKKENGQVDLMVKGETEMVFASGEVRPKDVSDAIETALKDYESAIMDVKTQRTEDNAGTVISFIPKVGEPIDVQVADLFLTSAEYNPDTHMLSLVVAGTEAPVEVDLSDLVPKAVDAAQVAMADDIVSTIDVGNIKKGEKLTVESIKDVQKMFEKLLSKDSNPVVTQPEAKVRLTGAGLLEVGSQFTPIFTAELTPGSYTDNASGPQSTNVTAEAYAISDTEGHTAATATGSFPMLTVMDDTEYQISATISHGQGAIPTTYLEKPFSHGQILAGNKTAVSEKVTGFRQGFYGSLNSKTEIVESTLVRSLGGKTNKKVVKGQKYTLPVPAGTRRVMLAYESSVGNVSSIKSQEQLGAEIKNSFTLNTIEVNDASGGNSKTYNVYVKDLASPQAAATNYDVTI